MTDGPVPSATWWQRVTRFLRRLAFDTWYDWLKAGVLAVVMFGVGNVTGWLKQEPRRIPATLNFIGDYIEGYTFYDAAFDAYEGDYGGAVTVRFDPEELRRVRYCAPATFTGRKEDLLDQIRAKTEGCLKITRTPSGQRTRVNIVKGDLLHRDDRRIRNAFFCECPDEVIDRFVADEQAP